MTDRSARRQPRFVRVANHTLRWLYRMRLGGLLGDRFLLITHVGRRSGKLHQTIVETFRHDRDRERYIIISGWGERSDWLRNIEHNPHVLLTVGGRRYAASAVRLSPAEAARELCDYAERRPRAFRYLARTLVRRGVSATEGDCQALAEVVPVLALQPQP